MFSTGDFKPMHSLSLGQWDCVQGHAYTLQSSQFNKVPQVSTPLLPKQINRLPSTSVRSLYSVLMSTPPVRPGKAEFTQ